MEFVKEKIDTSSKRQKLDQDKKVQFVATFPKNTGGHLPPWAHKQVKVWFDIMSKPSDKQSKEDLKTLNDFKFWYPGKDNRKNQKKERQEEMKACKAQKEAESKKKEDNKAPPSSILQPPPLLPPGYEIGNALFVAS